MFEIKGGNGKEGAKGRDSLYSDIDSCEAWKNSLMSASLEWKCKGNLHICVPQNVCEQFNKTKLDKCQHDCPASGGSIVLYKVDILGLEDIRAYFKKYGDAGKKGGDAGRGGTGGTAGYPGSALIEEYEKKLIIIKVEENETTSPLLRGDNGQPGKPGHGGFYGDTIYRTWYYDHVGITTTILTFGISNLLRFKNGFIKDEDRIENSTLRGLNGSVDSSLNNASIKKPLAIESTSLNSSKVYKLKTSYLAFLSEKSRVFKQSRLLHRPFYLSLLSLNNSGEFNADQLIERVKVLSGFESNHLLPMVIAEIDVYYRQADLSMENMRVLDYTRAAIASLSFRQKAAKETVLVVDIKAFLQLTASNLKQWQSVIQSNIRAMYRDDFKHTLKQKIDEANSFIATLGEEIAQRHQELNANIQRTVRQIDSLKKDSQSKDAALLKTKSDLEHVMRIKLFLGGLNITCRMLAFLGPKAAVIGSLGQAGVEFGSRLVKTDARPTLEKGKSEFVDKALADFNSFRKEIREQRLSQIKFDTRVLEIDDSQDNATGKSGLQRKPESSIEERISKLSETKEKYELNLKHTQLMSESDKSYRPKVKEAQKKLDPWAAKPKANKTENEQTKRRHVSRLVADLYRDHEASQGELKVIRDELEKNRQQYDALFEWQESLNASQNDLVTNTQSELDQLATRLYSKSLVHIDFKRWQIKELLNRMSNVLNGATRNLAASEEIEVTIRRMESSIETILRLFERIQLYVEQNELVSFMSRLNNADSSTLGIPEHLKSVINELKKRVEANMIAERYQQMVNAFRHWSFPFFCEFTRGYIIISDENLISDKLDDTVAKYGESVSQLLEIVKEQVATLKPKDNHVQSFKFDKETPFYKWSSLSNSYEITRLLTGSNVTLLADIGRVVHKRDALKFSTLNLEVEVIGDPKLNQTLNSLLGHFFIEMTHSGKSYYSFQQTTYLIDMNYQSDSEGNKLKLRYKYGDASTEFANDSKKKLAANKPVLSPYTFWEMRIWPLVESNRENFFKQLAGQLAQLKRDDREIRVSLTGLGEYLQDYNAPQTKCQIY